MGRAFNRGRKSTNEFDEIKGLSMGPDKAICKDDILDLKIDMGLYNQKAEKAVELEKRQKGKNKGKKKCATQKRGGARKGKTGRKARKVVKKSSGYCASTRKASESGILITR